MNNFESIRIILNKKQTSSYEKKIYFIGIVTQTIYDKTIFKFNKELHSYLKFYETFFDVPDGEFKPYLFRSRTLLAARVCRLINNEEDSTRLTKLFNYHIKFFMKKKDTVNKKNNVGENTLLGDMLKRK